MHNTFGRFIIKGTFDGGSMFLNVDNDEKPPLSLGKLKSTLIWDYKFDRPTVFVSTDHALAWVAFALKHTNASAVEIIRL